jgi:hypothetical protein
MIRCLSVRAYDQLRARAFRGWPSRIGHYFEWLRTERGRDFAGYAD